MMSGILEGKAAAITGAGTGLGRSYALTFAAHGASVVVNDRSVTVEGAALNSRSLADEVVGEIRAAAGTAVANYADVSDVAGAASITEDAVAAFGRLDILVNNAGIVRDSPFADMPVEDFDALIAVHLRGTFLVSQSAFSHMAERGDGGVIVNTTSRTGIRGKTGQANYAAAKAGIIGLSSVLALEGRDHGIRVWTVSPRMASRAWENGRVTSSGVITDELREYHTGDAAALAVLYMVSDRAAAYTGKVVFASADGLQEMRWQPARAWEPGRAADVDDVAKAVDGGLVLFADKGDLGAPV
jgi:NAD(P)-dependent dehydrogenase (short-subunit alcohol dehydrogenase family)